MAYKLNGVRKMDQTKKKYFFDPWVLDCISSALARRAEEIDPSLSFIANGGDSLKATLLKTSLTAKGYNITREMLLISPCLGDLLSDLQASLTGPVALPSSYSPPDTPSTEMDPLKLIFPEHSILDAAVLAGIPSSFNKMDPIRQTKIFSIEGWMAPFKENDIQKSQSVVTVSSLTSSKTSDISDLLTEMQLSLIHETITQPGSNIITYTEHHLPERVPALLSAWKKVMELEDIFHGTWFSSLLSAQTSEASLHRGVQTKSSRGRVAQDGKEMAGFSLEVAPSDLMKDQKPLKKITWKVHHAFIDACSLKGLLKKVRNLAAGLEVAAGSSFWGWTQQLRAYQLANKSQGDEFWRTTMCRYSNATGGFLLPNLANPEQSNDTGATDIETLHIDLQDSADELSLTATALNVTPAIFFYAAWAIVCGIFSDSDSIVFGAVLSGRDLFTPGSLNTVGPLLNVLPLYFDLSRNEDLEYLLKSLFRAFVELDTYCWTSTANGFSRQYDSALSVEMVDANDTENEFYRPLQSLTIQRSQTPISITVKNLQTIALQFHSDRFSQHDMASIASCYEQTISLLIKPQIRLGDVMESLLSCPSHAQLMKWGNCISGLTTGPSVTQDLVTLFEAAAQANPDATAVTRGDVRLSYQMLEITSGLVAHRLASMVSEGDVVCVHADRSINWICSIWAVLRAGCVYCPLDPGLPPKLRDAMIRSADAKAIITNTDDQIMMFESSACGQVFSVESIMGSEQSTFERRASPRPWTAAYVCFTSGSTGYPKPVLCTHAGLVAFQSDAEVRLHAKLGVRVSQIMSPAFDGSIHEIFSALTHGATLVLPAGGDSLGPLAVANSAILTPSAARALDPYDYPNLQWVYLVGEPVPQVVADKWSKCKMLYNMYGPTEATCGATIKRLLPGEPVTIGSPNPTTRLYILNSRKSLTQPGMIGRIYLAGVQISRGYLNMPEQTGDRFFFDSIMSNGEKMYDTGDLGYWNKSGEVVCVGRNDRQVKLRGYRLDLNDLEIRIARDIPEIEAVAIARHHVSDELVAMIQPADLAFVDFRARLTETLPQYAIPNHFVAVDKLPVTAVGKIDYKIIARVQLTGGSAEAALVTETEKAVASAFLEILPRVPPDTRMHKQINFIDIGGHSIEQIQLSRCLSRKFGMSITLRMIISNTTIETMALAIDEMRRTKKLEPLTTSPVAPVDVTPIEQEWIDKSCIGAGISCFNVAFLGRMDPDQIDTRHLERAFNVVLKRHQILRSTYNPVRRAGLARHRRNITQQYPRVEYLDAINIWTELNRPYKLDQDHPVRVFITRTEVLVVMSHVVADYTTMAVILREASLAYRGHQLSPPLAVYPDPTLWGGQLFDDHCNFWRLCLENPPPQPKLFKGQQRCTYQGRSTIFRFDEDTSRMLLQFEVAAKMSRQQLALALVALALDGPGPGSLHHELDMVLGVPYMNRGSIEHADTVGLFLQPLPVRLKHEWPAESTTIFLSKVQKAVQTALAHGIQWHQLLQLISIMPDYPDHPIFDIMVTFHEPHMLDQLSLDIPSLEQCFVWSAGAKFKLMCEFMAVSNSCVILRLEYDTNCLSSKDADGFLQRISSWASFLVAGPVLDSPTTWNGADAPQNGSVLEEEWALGRPLKDLALDS